MNILYLNGTHAPTAWPGLEKDIVNLRLDEMAQILSSGSRKIEASELTSFFCRDNAQINYRQGILRGLAGQPQLQEAFTLAAERMEKILEKLAKEKHILIDLRKRILEYYILQDYLQASNDLLAALESVKELPEELMQLVAALRKNLEASGAERVMANIASIDMEWLKLRSTWIGVNLGDKPQMKPYAIVFGEYNEKPYANNTIFDNELVEEGLGISRLKPLKLQNHQKYFERLILTNFQRHHKVQIRIFLETLVFNRPAIEDFCELALSLRFYTACQNLSNRLTAAGYPVCMPQMAAEEEKVFDARGLYSAGLALDSETHAVDNDVNLSNRFFLLTGANHSGKTELLVSVAQAQWFSQLGCYVPAKQLKISPVPAVMSLFSSGETQRYDESRMGNEIRQFSEMTSAMLPHTMLLLNEPMTSTNPDEGAALCCDMVSLILEKKGRGIMVTHLYELFDLLDKKGIDPAAIGSLVTETLLASDGSTQKTFHVAERKPECRSYALELSRQAGITLEQFIQDAQRDHFEIPISPEVLSRLHSK